MEKEVKLVYEVEQKFVLTEPERFSEQLVKRAVQWRRRVEEADTYFQHPSRDFVQTDEAFRIREHSVTDLIQETPPQWESFLTYKGPRLDSRIKIRKELELPLMGEISQWQEMLECLGFQKVRTVRKIRHKAWYLWQDTTVEISLDDVPPLGQYVELEVVVQDRSALEEARETILSLAQELGLHDVEPRSYLDLVLSHPSCEMGESEK